MTAKNKIPPSRLPEPKLEPTRAVRVDITPNGYKKSMVKVQTFGEVHHVARKKRPHRGGAPRGKAKFWTEEKDELVRRMWIAGRPVGEIADALHIEKNRVASHIDRMRQLGELPARKMEGTWTNEEIQKLTVGYSNGLSLDEIAAQVGRTKGACSAKLSVLRKEGKFSGRKRAFYYRTVRGNRHN